MMSLIEFVTAMREQMAKDGLPPASMQELEEDYRSFCREEMGKEQSQTIEGVMEYLS